MAAYETIVDKTREEEFKRKLNALLEEYEVEMEVISEMDGHYASYPKVDFQSFKFEDVGTHFINSNIDFSISGGVYGPKFSKI